MWLKKEFIFAVLKIIFRHPIVGVCLIPVLPDDRIVLVYRRDTQQWSLPGGMVDWGEDIPHALRRELKEETGLEVTNIKRLVGVYSSPNRDPRIHSISILIAVDVIGEMNVEDTFEITDIKVFAVEDIPIGNLAHDHDRQLTDYLNNKTTIA